MDAKEVWADKVDVRGDIGSDRMADDSIYISFFFFFLNCYSQSDDFWRINGR